ncbi:AHH domain-containing protein [Microcoleus sp. ARI1-B5]|uniref:AHH domain-containing protein n=1 Tax=unclassified Microcoleus TaxID=2642155 RepID=UPI002FD4053A
MGMGQWTNQVVTAGSVFHKRYNIQPGEYLMMYDQYAQEFLIKDVKTGKIVKTESLSSPLDLAMLISHLHISEKIEPEIAKALERGETPRTTELIDHHIIPVHLWDKSELIKQVVRITNIDMNASQNIIPLPHKIHKSYHGFKSGYSEMVLERLRDEWNLLVNDNKHNNPVEVEETLLALIAAIRDDLTELAQEEISIGDWYGIALFNMFKKPKSN